MKGYLGIEKEEQIRAGGRRASRRRSTELVELSSLSTPLSLPVAQWPQVREMAAVCGLCGDRGWPETLVCCVVCSDAHRHCYCLDDVNLIFKADLRWICEDCLPITPRATVSVAPRRSERLRAMPLKVEKMEIAEPKKDKVKKSRRFKIKKKAKTNLALRRSERLKEIWINLETET
ncbi:hypothetical protein Dimus_011459 [Dionaea muscipula]